MFKAIWKLGIVDFEDIREVRRAALVESGEMTEEEAFDANDALAAHLYVALETGEKVATARIYAVEKITRLGHIAVSPEFRGQGYEEFCLRMLLYKAQQLSADLVQAYVQEKDAELYERMGFKLNAEGEPFSVYAIRKSSISLAGSCH